MGTAIPEWERDILSRTRPRVLYGIDEAGRGPLAGAVVATAVSLWGHIEQGLEYLARQGVTDSKKLTGQTRREKINAWGIPISNLTGANTCLFPLTSQCGMGLSVAENPPARIDQINILQASLEAMQLAFEKLHRALLQKEGLAGMPYCVLVDGPHLPTSWKGKEWARAVVKGDSRSLAIGAASIVAKEYRDALMQKLDQSWPGYGFAHNAGYPTKQHKEAIGRLGVTPEHRKTFRGVL